MSLSANASVRPIRVRRRPARPDANVDDRPPAKRALKRISSPCTRYGVFFSQFILTVLYSSRQTSDESYASAEAIFTKRSSAQSAFQRLQYHNLQKLCSVHGISVIATGKGGEKALKCDYVSAIMRYVSSLNCIATQADAGV